jgi:hypothetical protein
MCALRSSMLAVRLPTIVGGAEPRAADVRLTAAFLGGGADVRLEEGRRRPSPLTTVSDWQTFLAPIWPAGDRSIRVRRTVVTDARSYTSSYRQPPGHAGVTSALPRQSGTQARRTNSRGEPSSIQTVGIVFVITPAGCGDAIVPKISPTRDSCCVGSVSERCSRCWAYPTATRSLSVNTRGRWPAS